MAGYTQKNKHEPDLAPGYEMPRHHDSIEALYRGVPWTDVKAGRYDAPPIKVDGQDTAC
jgi:hypothetical protein